MFQFTNDFDMQIEFLKDQVKELKVKRMLEFGTDYGDSTRIFCEALKETGGQLITVDIKPPKWQPEWMKYDNFLSFTCNALDYKPSGLYDLIFIDDDHTYPHVKLELEKFRPFVREGGRILLHDTLHSEFGEQVSQSISEFCKAEKLKWYNDKRGHGIGVIQC